MRARQRGGATAGKEAICSYELGCVPVQQLVEASSLRYALHLTCALLAMLQKDEKPK